MSAIIAIAAAENAALIPVTAFGVSPAWDEAAASTRPILRFTNLEYAGEPFAGGFCAPASRGTVPRKDSPSGAAVVATPPDCAPAAVVTRRSSARWPRRGRHGRQRSPS